MASKYELEVIGFDIASCVLAEKYGAHRIELCANPKEGGTTPSLGMIKKARSVTQIQIFPIIRPRGGDFLYSDEEFEIMKTDILTCKEAGCDGVVIGLLKQDGTIDIPRTTELVLLAGNMDVTFHRAFDRVSDPKQSLEDVIATGCKRILTSGQHPTVLEGLKSLKALVEQARDRIIIMPGSGVRSGNIIEIAKETGAKSFHSSAGGILNGKMTYKNPEMKEELTYASIDIEELKNIDYQLKTHFN